MKPTSITRHILQGRTPAPVATTAAAAAAAQAYYAMILAAWEVADTSPTMPAHNWAQIGLNPAYDASKYCGDLSQGGVYYTQHAYATAVCYTLALPQDAIAGDPCFVTGLNVRLYGDRWLADGAILSAIFGAIPTPPPWGEILERGHHTEPLMSTTPDNHGPDTTTDVIYTWDADNTAPAYVHLVLRLADYTTARGAWIEGSALLDANSIELTFSREVAPDPGAEPPDPSLAPGNLVVPLRYRDDFARTPYTFTGGGINLDSAHLRLHWAADMLRGGHVVPGTPDNVTCLAPALSEGGLSAGAIGHIAHCWCPISGVAGSTAWFRAEGPGLPAQSTLRVSLYRADSDGNGPDPTVPGTWQGIGDGCIGSASVSRLRPGDRVGVPLRKQATGEVWVVCCVEHAHIADGPFGDAVSGLSMLDAHIAARPVLTAPAPHFVALGAVNPAVPISAMRAPDNDSLVYFPRRYATYGADWIAGTSCSMSWLDPDAVGPFRQVSVITGTPSVAFAAGIVDYPIVLNIAGAESLPSAIKDQQGRLCLSATALSQQVLAMIDTDLNLIAVAGPLGSVLSGAINAAGITNAHELVGHRDKLLVRTGGSVQVVGINVNTGLKAAVGGVTVAAQDNKMSIGDTYAAFIAPGSGNLTVLAIADGSTVAHGLTPNVFVSAATSQGVVVGVTGTVGELRVYGGEDKPGLDAATIDELNSRYVFSSVVSATNGVTPAFIVAVIGERV